MRLSRLDLALMVVATILVFAVFGRTLRTEFVAWDDDINIYKNEHVYGLTAANLKWMFTDLQQALRYKPLNWFTWALLYSIEGRLNAFNYHLANLLFHCANTLLVFLLLRHLLLRRTNAPSGSTQRNVATIAAMLGTAFWTFNPLRVEPVAWATGLPYGQATFFALISLLCYFKAETLTAEPARRKRFYWFSVAAFALAVFTYPIVFGFPAVLVIIDVLVLRRFEQAGGWWNAPAKRIWLEKLPFAAITALILLITLYGRSQARGEWTQMTSLDAFGVDSRIMQSFYVWAYYFWKPWFPTDLSPVYATLTNFRPTDAPFVASMLLVVALSIALFIWRKRTPQLCALWLCHLILLVPLLGLTEHPHYPNDRYDYLVGILWAAFLAGALWELGQRAQIFPIACAALAAIIALLTNSTREQLPVWENRFTLYQHIVATIPDGIYRANIWFRYGTAHMQIKEWPQAIAALKQSLRIAPGDPMTHNNIAICYSESHRLDRSIPHFREAVHLGPNDPQRHDNLAKALKLNGQVEEAKRVLLRAQELESERAKQPGAKK